MPPRTPTSAKTGSGSDSSHSGHCVIQVELIAALRRVGARATSKSSFRFAPADESDISGLYELLDRHKLDVAHPSFRIRHAGQRRRRRQQEKDHLSRFVDLHFPAGVDVTSVLRELRGLPEVAQAVEVRTLIPASIPTDPLIGMGDQLGYDPASGWEYQWYLYRCRVDRAWAHASGKGVVIADLDSGFFLKHQDLTPNLELVHTHNAFDGSPDVTVGLEVSHGTAVLGIAGAAANGVGIAGFAFGARLWPIQINDGNSTQLAGDALANAIDWVTGEDSSGRRVVILVECQTDNGGNCEQRLAVNAAIRLAIAKGFVVCVTAGNGDRDAGLADDGTPITATGSILVGATAYDAATNPRAVWGAQASNWGSRVVVSAPGDPNHDVTCDRYDGMYRSDFGGTSGSAAKVAGTIALMIEANPALSHDRIKSILIGTGSSLNPAPPIGVFLNAEAAVLAAAKSQLVT